MPQFSIKKKNNMVLKHFILPVDHFKANLFFSHSSSKISELVGRAGDHGLCQLLVEGVGGGVGVPAGGQRGQVEDEFNRSSQPKARAELGLNR